MKELSTSSVHMKDVKRILKHHASKARPVRLGRVDALKERQDHEFWRVATGLGNIRSSSLIMRRSLQGTRVQLLIAQLVLDETLTQVQWCCPCRRVLKSLRSSGH